MKKFFVGVLVGLAFGFIAGVASFPHVMGLIPASMAYEGIVCREGEGCRPVQGMGQFPSIVRSDDKLDGIRSSTESQK